MPKRKRPDNTTAWDAAKKYVNAQLDIMKRFGSAPKLSNEAYEQLVQKVANAAK